MMRWKDERKKRIWWTDARRSAPAVTGGAATGERAIARIVLVPAHRGILVAQIDVYVRDTSILRGVAVTIEIELEGGDGRGSRFLEG